MDISLNGYEEIGCLDPNAALCLMVNNHESRTSIWTRPPGCPCSTWLIQIQEADARPSSTIQIYEITSSHNGLCDDFLRKTFETPISQWHFTKPKI